MRNNQLLDILFIAFLNITFLSCTNTIKKNERGAMEQERADIEQKNNELQADIKEYKRINNEYINANNNKIVEFRAKINSWRQEDRSDYLKKINDLEQKNLDIKTKLDNFRDDGEVNWGIFKSEFNNEIKELNQTFKEFTTANINKI